MAESSANHTAEQAAILASPKIVAYLNDKCVKDGSRPGWRKWDPQVNVDNETELWKKLWAATKPTLGGLPCIVIVAGQKGEVLPLPSTEAATLELLKRYGG